MKHLRIIFLLILAAVAPALASDEEAGIAVPEALPSSKLDAARAEITGFLNLAKSALDRNNPALAETFYERMLNVEAPDLEKRDGLLQFAAYFEQKKSCPKAIAIYEQFSRMFPRDPQAYQILLKLGGLYRDSGAYQLAINRYYSVLNSVLKVQKENLATYKTATLKAQFEIADTYFLMGDYAQAAKYFKLIKVLDLNSEDKARVHFKSLYCQFLLGDFPNSIVSAQAFVREFPDDKKLAESRFILATSLKSTNKPKEALEQVLELLRNQKPKQDQDPETWAYWQKKTGNEFANQFYQQGDFISALTIYQSLARLNNDPEWQWPVVYQMALCFERMRLPPRAIEAYKFIVDESKKPERAGKLTPALTSLSEMARWHIDQLNWQQTTESQLQSLLGAPELPEPLHASTIPNIQP